MIVNDSFAIEKNSIILVSYILLLACSESNYCSIEKVFF